MTRLKHKTSGRVAEYTETGWKFEEATLEAELNQVSRQVAEDFPIGAPFGEEELVFELIKKMPEFYIVHIDPEPTVLDRVY